MLLSARQVTKDVSKYSQASVALDSAPFWGHEAPANRIDVVIGSVGWLCALATLIMLTNNAYRTCQRTQARAKTTF